MTPKSDNNGSPVARNNTLFGFTPPCTTPRACAAANAVAAAWPRTMTFAGSRRPTRRTSAASDCVHSSIRTAVRPSGNCSTPCTGTIDGTAFVRSLFCSRSKTDNARRATLPGNTFRATGMPS
nr:hypothetical protein [Labedaea rhizosphaerae]